MVEFKIESFWVWITMIVDYYESIRQMSWAFVWSPANFKEELPAAREALINAD